ERLAGKEAVRADEGRERAPAGVAEDVAFVRPALEQSVHLPEDAVPLGDDALDGGRVLRVLRPAVLVLDVGTPRAEGPLATSHDDCEAALARDTDGLELPWRSFLLEEAVEVEQDGRVLRRLVGDQEARLGGPRLEAFGAPGLVRDQVRVRRAA